MRTETIIREIFTFDELSDEAKEKARDWWREGGLDYEWWDCAYGDFDTVAKLLGIDIDRKGKHTPAIFFSGFWSQGDGACFEGEYRYQKGSVKAIEEYAPKDTTLLQIAKDLQLAQSRQFYKLRATVKSGWRGCASYNASIEVYHDDDRYRDIADAEEGVKEALRDFMNWMYRRLEAEYDWLNSDENVDEAIRCNEYEFTEDGRIA